ncbi:MAG: molybdate ABC transporter permease subunit [Alphaproteobacteria bacterium]
MLQPLTPAEWDAVALSLRVAFIATLIGLPFGILFSVILARCRFPGRAAVDALIHLPLVMPPVVVGYLLLIAFGRQGPLGAFLEQTTGLVLAFRWTGAALAAAVMGLPLMVRAIRLSLEAVDTRLEAAAATLGATRLEVFLTVTLPLILPGIVAGSVLMFARALGEFGATITFVGNIPGVTQTLPSAIYENLQIPGGDAAALRLTVISVIIAFVALLLSEAVARRATARATGR